MTDEERAALVQAQAERWNDPATQAGAKERADRAAERAKLLDGSSREQLAALRRAPKFHQRLFWLRELSKNFARAVAPEAACRSGCAGCCFQPVMISQAEAEVIAKETKQALQTPPEWRIDPPSEFVGQRCTFLGEDNRCTIYESRPMACRLLFNMDRDELLCQIVPGSAAKVPYANAMQYQMLVVEAHGPFTMPDRDDPDFESKVKAQVRLADIREFFPPKP